MIRRDQALTQLLKSLHATRVSDAEVVQRHADVVANMIAGDPDSCQQCILAAGSLVAFAVATDPDGLPESTFEDLGRISDSPELTSLLHQQLEAMRATGDKVTPAVEEQARAILASGRGGEALVALGFWLVIGFELAAADDPTTLDGAITTFVGYAVGDRLIDPVELTNNFG